LAVKATGNLADGVVVGGGEGDVDTRGGCSFVVLNIRTSLRGRGVASAPLSEQFCSTAANCSSGA
jgi:hypothetical protein